MPAIELTAAPLTIEQVEQVARANASVSIAESTIDAIRRCNAALQAAIARGNPIYGVNTGFGSFARTRIADPDIATVQHNILRSHAAGVTDPLPEETVRAMMVILAASLARGHSGVRPIVVEQIINLLNSGITPVVPAVGSVGASGDLAPLSHVALVLIGEGTATRNGQTLSGADALAQTNIQPIELGPKEGLALINGTHLMAAQGALALADTKRLTHAAVCAAAMSIDACRASDSYLDPRVHDIRCQPGPAHIAHQVRALLAGSQILPSHKTDDPRVQDPYSLRCIPQVIGAATDAIAYVRSAIENELGAVTDNPLVFSDNTKTDVISAGAFHGMPLALPLDTLTIAIAHLAGIAERRVYYILAASDSENPINPHLSPVPGLHSGLMIVQYTAAACCNEIITLSSPASVANLSTSAGMEDYNSFGPRAAAKARRAIELATHVVAIELLCAAEALEYQRPLKSGAGVEMAHDLVRTVVPRLTADRPPAPDIAAIARLITDGRFSA